MLPFGELWEADRRLAVATDLGMAKMTSGHENAAGRRADRGPRVELRQPDGVGGQPVDVGSGNLLLAVAADLSPAQIVGHDQHDIEPRRRLLVGSRRRGGQGGTRHKAYCKKEVHEDS